MKKLLIGLIFSGFHAFAQTARYDSLWKDPTVEKRIAEGIEQHRKGDFTLLFPDLQGKAEVEIQMVKHDFMFGANIFMLKGFKTEAENRRYEEVFKSLFNLACVPFIGKPSNLSGENPAMRSTAPPFTAVHHLIWCWIFVRKTALHPKDIRWCGIILTTQFLLGFPSIRPKFNP